MAISEVILWIPKYSYLFSQLPATNLLSKWTSYTYQPGTCFLGSAYPEQNNSASTFSISFQPNYKLKVALIIMRKNKVDYAGNWHLSFNLSTQCIGVLLRDVYAASTWFYLNLYRQKLICCWLLITRDTLFSIFSSPFYLFIYYKYGIIW